MPQYSRLVVLALFLCALTAQISAAADPVFPAKEWSRKF
jgi:hypothetical protein